MALIGHSCLALSAYQRMDYALSIVVFVYQGTGEHVPGIQNPFKQLLSPKKRKTKANHYCGSCYRQYNNDSFPSGYDVAGKFP